MTENLSDQEQQQPVQATELTMEDLELETETETQSEAEGEPYVPDGVEYDEQEPEFDDEAEESAVNSAPDNPVRPFTTEAPARTGEPINKPSQTKKANKPKPKKEDDGTPSVTKFMWMLREIVLGGWLQDNGSIALMPSAAPESRHIVPNFPEELIVGNQLYQAEETFTVEVTVKGKVRQFVRCYYRPKPKAAAPVAP